MIFESRDSYFSSRYIGIILFKIGSNILLLLLLLFLFLKYYYYYYYYYYLWLRLVPRYLEYTTFQMLILLY